MLKYRGGKIKKSTQRVDIRKVLINYIILYFNYLFYKIDFF